MLTVGACVSAALLTLTITCADVVDFPEASRATAVNVSGPLVDVAVFQDTEYGEATSSAPRLTPFNLNCTPTTPTSSEAFAVTLTVPETFPTGAVIFTVGACVSLFTLTITLADVVVLPAASRATALNVSGPF